MLSPNKDYAFYAIIALLSVFSIFYCFSVVGLPSQQKAKVADRSRLERMTSFTYEVNNYYSSNRTLPASSIEFPNVKSYVDPETSVPFSYEKLTNTSYKLCATFASTATNHKSGYDCITYTVPNNY